MIEVKHLTKRYGKHLAVDDLSFTVEDRTICGFLGPNGAGKSTTMNILTGCLAATEGEVTVNGYDIFEEPVEAKRQIGYLPEIPPVYPDSTVREYLRFVAEARKVPKEQRKAEIDRVIALTGITEYENRLIRHMSKGYRQRTGIAEALVGNPEVIILDEPTVGLDPQQIVEIRTLIASLKEEHTVILSSHILSEVQAVSDKVLIINRGRIVANDTPENLEKLFRNRTTVTAKLDGNEADVRAALENAIEGAALTFRSEEGAVEVTVTSSELDEKALARQLSAAAAEKGLLILSLNVEHADLETIFLELTENDAAAPGAPKGGNES